PTLVLEGPLLRLGHVAKLTGRGADQLERAGDEHRRRRWTVVARVSPRRARPLVDPSIGADREDVARVVRSGDRQRRRRLVLADRSPAEPPARADVGRTARAAPEGAEVVAVVGAAGVVGPAGAGVADLAPVDDPVAAVAVAQAEVEPARRLVAGRD